MGRGLGPWCVLAVALLEPPTLLLTRRRSSGVSLVPPGGVVLAANHISHADPVVLADFLLCDLHRAPRFLAERELLHRDAPAPRYDHRPAEQRRTA